MNTSMINTPNKKIIIAQDIIELSIKEILIGYRFFSLSLDKFTYEFEDKIATIGTDGQKVYANPDFVINNYRTSRYSMNKAHIHMLYHCLLKHPFKDENRDIKLWDLATDIAVSFGVDELNNRYVPYLHNSIREKIKEDVRKNTKHLTAQLIYEYLKSLRQDEINLYSRIFVVDDHMHWYSNQMRTKRLEQSRNQTNSDSSNSDEGQNSQRDNSNQDQTQGPSTSEPMMDPEQQQRLNDEWSDLNSSLQLELKMVQKKQGIGAGNSDELLRLENVSRYDYSEFLKKFSVLKEEIKVDLDSFDYIFYTYGLKLYKNMPLIEPLEYKDTKKIYDFVIVIDTSGSVWGEDVKKFLNKTYSILKSRENFHRKMNVHIIQCDAEVQDDIVIHSEEEFNRYIENFRVKGGGGTDFRPAFTYVNQLIQDKHFTNLKGMLYFTDGFGTYPEKRPDYDAAFVFLRDVYSNINVPPWGIKLILDPEDL